MSSAASSSPPVAKTTVPGGGRRGPSFDPSGNHSPAGELVIAAATVADGRISAKRVRPMRRSGNGSLVRGVTADGARNRVTARDRSVLPPVRPQPPTEPADANSECSDHDPRFDAQGGDATELMRTYAPISALAVPEPTGMHCRAAGLVMHPTVTSDEKFPTLGPVPPQSRTSSTASVEETPGVSPRQGRGRSDGPATDT